MVSNRLTCKQKQSTDGATTADFSPAADDVGQRHDERYDVKNKSYTI